MTYRTEQVCTIGPSLAQAVGALAAVTREPHVEVPDDTNLRVSLGDAGEAVPIIPRDTFANEVSLQCMGERFPFHGVDVFNRRGSGLCQLPIESLAGSSYSAGMAMLQEELQKAPAALLITVVGIEKSFVIVLVRNETASLALTSRTRLSRIATLHRPASVSLGVAVAALAERCRVLPWPTGANAAVIPWSRSEAGTRNRPTAWRSAGLGARTSVVTRRFPARCRVENSRCVHALTMRSGRLRLRAAPNFFI